MGIDFAVLKKADVEHLESFRLANRIAEGLRQYLELPDIEQQIRERHILGASSSAIQEVILRKAGEMGFENEKKGLFANCKVPGLRPDYYCRIADTGILLEVERGKTT